MQTSERQALKAQAHHLKAVVLLGAKGLTPAVIAETDSALLIHELIKVKINGAEKADREIIAAELCDALNATLVQLIGSTAIMYRENEQEHVAVTDAVPSRGVKKTTGSRKPVAGRRIPSETQSGNKKYKSNK